MTIHHVINSLFTSNTWVVELGASVWLVDCGDVAPILRLIGNKQLSGILLTHAHFDHIYGLNELLDRFPDTPVYTNESGREALLDDRKNMSRYHETPFVLKHPECIKIIQDGDLVELCDNVTAKVIATPGHNDSCLTFVMDDAIFTGDAYIPGIKVVTKLPGGDKNIAKQSLEIITELSKGKTVYPGHGDFEPLHA